MFEYKTKITVGLARTPLGAGGIEGEKKKTNQKQSYAYLHP